MMYFRDLTPRRIAAIALLALPLAAYPLVFAGPFAGRDLSAVQAVTTGVIGLYALGIAIAFPERLFAVFRTPRHMAKIAVLLAALLTAGAFARTVSGDTWTKFAATLFYTALPLGAISVGDELKKLLPGALIFFGALALLYGAISPHGEGVLLNWNWNATLILSGAGALCVKLFPRRGAKFRIFTGLFFAALLALAYFRRGNYFSLGSWLALVAATFSAALLSRLPAGRRGICAGLAALLLGALFFFAPQAFPRVLDCRVQLWRGTHEVIRQNALTGVGVGNFEDRIQEKLPDEYYFSPLPAARHPHPHNEMLFYFAVFGIAGGLFLAALIAAAAENGGDDDAARLLLWAMLLFFFHGAVDVLLGEALPGTLFFACAGALIGGEAAEIRLRRCQTILFGIALFAALFFSCRIFLATTHYRRAAALFRRHAPCRAEIDRALDRRADAKTFYLAGCERMRAGDFAQAEKMFERLHRELHVGGYFHSNRLAGISAMETGNFRRAAQYLANEERRYPFSIVNAAAMAALAQKLPLPVSDRELAGANVVSLLEMRGKTIADLDGILATPALDDTLPCVRGAQDPAPARSSKR